MPRPLWNSGTGVGCGSHEFVLSCELLVSHPAEELPQLDRSACPSVVEDTPLREILKAKQHSRNFVSSLPATIVLGFSLTSCTQRGSQPARPPLCSR